MSGLEIGKYLEQGTGKAVDGVHQFPCLGLGQWGQGVKGAVYQGIAVKEQ
jgi:hypothetical protein